MSWRDSARPIITKVLAENKDKSEKEIKKALREAYPFGERAMHPYKVWCDEIQRQRGKKKGINKNGRYFKITEADKNQLKLL